MTATRHQTQDPTDVLSPRSLLVVDDSEGERELLALTLGAAFPAAEILRAADPSMARQMCSARDFDCVLVDYNMPDMDGVTLAGELRLAAAYLPIVLLTSVGDEMLAARALRSGVSDYIPKSRVNTDSIRRTVARSMLSPDREIRAPPARVRPAHRPCLRKKGHTPVLALSSPPARQQVGVPGYGLLRLNSPSRHDLGGIDLSRCNRKMIAPGGDQNAPAESTRAAGGIGRSIDRPRRAGPG